MSIAPLVRGFTSRFTGTRRRGSLQVAQKPQKAPGGIPTKVFVAWAPIGALKETTPRTEGFTTDKGWVATHTLDLPGLDGTLLRRSVSIFTEQNAGGLIASRLFPTIVSTLSRETVISLSVAGFSNPLEQAFARENRFYLFKGTDPTALANPIKLGFLGAHERDHTGKRIASDEDLRNAKNFWCDTVLWHARHKTQEMLRHVDDVTVPEMRKGFASALRSQRAMAQLIVKSTMDSYYNDGQNDGKVLVKLEDFQLEMTAFMLLNRWIEEDRDPALLTMNHFLHIPEVPIENYESLGLPKEIIHDMYLLRAFNYSMGFHTEGYRDTFFSNLKQLGIDFTDPKSLHFQSEECQELFSDEELQRTASAMQRALFRPTPSATLRVGASTREWLSISGNREKLPEGSIQASDPHSHLPLESILDGTFGAELQALARELLAVPMSHTDSVKIDLQQRYRQVHAPSNVTSSQRAYDLLSSTPLARLGVGPHDRGLYPADAKYEFDKSSTLRVPVLGPVGRRDIKNGNPEMLLFYHQLCKEFCDQFEGTDLAEIDPLELPPFLLVASVRARPITHTSHGHPVDDELMAARDNFVSEAIATQVKRGVIDADGKEILLAKVASRAAEEWAERASSLFLQLMENMDENDALRETKCICMNQDQFNRARADQSRLQAIRDDKSLEGRLQRPGNRIADDHLRVALSTENDVNQWATEGLTRAIQRLDVHGLVPCGKDGLAVQNVCDLNLMYTQVAAGRELVGVEHKAAQEADRTKCRPKMEIINSNAPIWETVVGLPRSVVGIGTYWPCATENGDITYVPMEGVQIPDGFQFSIIENEHPHPTGFAPGAVVLDIGNSLSPLEQAAIYKNALRRVREMSDDEFTIRSAVGQICTSFEQGVLHALDENAIGEGRGLPVTTTRGSTPNALEVALAQ